MPRSPDLPCAGCGKLLWRGTTSLPEGEAMCNPCRRDQHGQVGYKRGCRCDACREAKAAEARAYRVTVRERDGVSLSSKRTSATRYYWIPPVKRQAVYERDDWVCQLCFDPVDRSLDPHHRFAATLDHIECQSWVLIPDHSPGNPAACASRL